MNPQRQIHIYWITVFNHIKTVLFLAKPLFWAFQTALCLLLYLGLGHWKNFTWSRREMVYVIIAGTKVHFVKDFASVHHSISFQTFQSKFCKKSYRWTHFKLWAASPAVFAHASYNGHHLHWAAHGQKKSMILFVFQLYQGFERRFWHEFRFLVCPISNT